MSSRERHRQSKRLRTLCAACRERKARFMYRREVRADRDHTLCFECFRGQVNRTRAQGLSHVMRPPAPGAVGDLAPAAGRHLDDRQRAHRQRMLDHLQRMRPVAS